MEIHISTQIVQALASIALGIAGGFYYDVLRAVRRRFDSAVITFLLDCLFWIVCAAALFFFGLTLGGGEQRFFIAILAFLGGWLYFLTLSPYALWLCESVLELFRFVLLCAAAPFLFIFHTLKKLFLFTKNIFSYLKKWCTIKAQYYAAFRSLFNEEVFYNYETQKNRPGHKNRRRRSRGLRNH